MKPLDNTRVLIRVLINYAHEVLEIIIGIEEKIAMYIVKLSKLLLNAQDTYFSYNKYS